MRKNDPTRYIPKEAIQEIFRKLGIEKDIPTVVYTGKGAYSKRGDGWGQTMTAYSLSRFGHEEIYLLDGGIDKWKEEGKELTNIFPTVEESYFNVEVRDDYYIKYDEFIEIKDDEEVIVLDARPSKYFEGSSLWSKPGHIPGAKNLQAATFMQPHNLQFMKPESEIKRMAEERGAKPDKTIICYCGTGREATNLFLTFKWFLGYKKVRLYEGSFTEWAQRDDNPTVTGAGPY
jgi:thiosulfate/3-mercaptopyruvate sulfurtransferase